MSNPFLHLSILFFIAATLIGFGHYFPWTKILHRKLSNIEAYAYGTAVICGTACVGFLYMNEIVSIAILLTVAAGAGFTTITLYLFDGWTETQHQIEDAKDMANLANERLHQDFED